MDDDRRHYSPLLEQYVDCDLLEVQFVKFSTEGRSRGTTAVPEDATDADGNLITLLATDRVADLHALICKPGRYRIIARSDDGKLLAQKDRLMRPATQNRSPSAHIDPAPRVASDRSAVETLLQEQVKALQTANSAQQAALDTLQKDARDRSIEAAEARTRSASLQERVLELEGQREELRDKLAQVQAMLEKAERQLADAQVSPLDTLGGIREGLGLIKDTVREFNDE